MLFDDVIRDWNFLCISGHAVTGSLVDVDQRVGFDSIKIILGFGCDFGDERFAKNLPYGESRVAILSDVCQVKFFKEAVWNHGVWWNVILLKIHVP